MTTISTQNVVAALVVGVWACAGPASSPSGFPTFDELDVATSAKCDLDKARIRGGCTSPSCGGNSPVINGFPINGVHPKGCANAEGLRLVPDSLESKWPNCSGATLDVEEHGQLVGRKGGVTTCSGDELKQAIFRVTKGSKRLRILIEDIAPQTTHQLSNSRIIPGYLLVAADGGSSLCTRDTAARWRSDAGLKALPTATDVYRHDGSLVSSSTETATEHLNPDDLAVFMKGELYDDTEKLMTKPSDGWINISCLRDALAKLDHYEIARSNDGGNAAYLANRSAGLRMLTANYCGNRSRYTITHTFLAWQMPTAAFKYPNSPEAVWNPVRATCLSASRMFTGAELPKEVLPPDCTPWNKCKDEQEFLKAIRTECKLADGGPPPCEHDLASGSLPPMTIPYRRSTMASYKVFGAP